MATIVLAVGMIIARLSALVAVGDYIIGNSLSQALIKNKVFTYEFVFQSILFYLLRVFDDSAVKLKYIFEADMFHPRTGLFTTNTSGAIHEQRLIFLVAHQVFNNL